MLLEMTAAWLSAEDVSLSAWSMLLQCNTWTIIQQLIIVCVNYWKLGVHWVASIHSTIAIGEWNIESSQGNFHGFDPGVGAVTFEPPPLQVHFLKKKEETKVVSSKVKSGFARAGTSFSISIWFFFVTVLLEGGEKAPVRGLNRREGDREGGGGVARAICLLLLGLPLNVGPPPATSGPPPASSGLLRWVNPICWGFNLDQLMMNS